MFWKTGDLIAATLASNFHGDWRTKVRVAVRSQPPRYASICYLQVSDNASVGRNSSEICLFRSVSIWKCLGTFWSVANHSPATKLSNSPGALSTSPPMKISHKPKTLHLPEHGDLVVSFPNTLGRFYKNSRKSHPYPYVSYVQSHECEPVRSFPGKQEGPVT